MNPEHVRVLVARRMQQATEALEDGRYLLAAGRGARTAVNRAYYAAFDIAEVLLDARVKRYVIARPDPRRQRYWIQKGVGATNEINPRFTTLGILVSYHY